MQQLKKSACRLLEGKFVNTRVLLGLFMRNRLRGCLRLLGILMQARAGDIFRPLKLMFLLSDTRGSNETGRVDFRGSFLNSLKPLLEETLLHEPDWFFQGRRGNSRVCKSTLSYKKVTKAAQYMLILIGYKTYFFAQSQTSVRINLGTGSFRVASQGLSRPVLEHFPFLIFAFISFRFTLSKITERKVYTVYTALIWLTLCFLLFFHFNKCSQQLQNSPLKLIP